jgi:hypothetical protein
MNRLSVTDLIKVARSRVLVGSTYKHYKGNLYEVKDVVLYEKTIRPLVVYQDTINHDLVWARDFDEFCSAVRLNGKDIPRFSLMN